MKVFISWSGERSRRVAEALRDWLPGALQAVEPWLSSKDLAAGERWELAIMKALEESRVGLMCLTKDNLRAGWLHFEAGALSKLSNSLLCLYSLDVEPNEISGPLSQFQVVRADQHGTLLLLEALNRASERPHLSGANLQHVFDLWWPELEKALRSIPLTSVPSDSSDSLEQKMDRALELLEVLTNSERAQRHLHNWAGSIPPGKPTSHRPRAFIGSSTEGLDLARAIQELLDPVADCTVWNQGVFSPGSTFIESLQDARLVYDFAIVVLTPDDTTISRGHASPAVRDNLLFELGFFAGALGRARAFLVLPSDSPPRLPSDLSGVTTTTFRTRADGNVLAALGPAVSQITRAMGIAKNAV